MRFSDYQSESLSGSFMLMFDSRGIGKFDFANKENASSCDAEIDSLELKISILMSPCYECDFARIGKLAAHIHGEVQ